MAPLPDTHEIARIGLDADKPFLGSPTVVETLLRDLMAQVTTARGAQLADGTDPMPTLEAAAQRFQTVFYGQDPAYRGSPWNSPRHLGRALVEQAGMGGDREDAVYRLAVRVMAEVARIVAEFEADKLTDQQVQDAIDAAVDLYRGALMGLPVAQEPAEG